MHPEAQRLSDLLDAERAAARAADVERLLALQEEKREALDALQRIPGAVDGIDELAVRARENVTLMRHLVGMLRSLSGTDAEETYGPGGERRSVGPGIERGRV